MRFYIPSVDFLDFIESLSKDDSKKDLFLGYESYKAQQETFIQILSGSIFRLKTDSGFSLKEISIFEEVGENNLVLLKEE